MISALCCCAEGGEKNSTETRYGSQFLPCPSRIFALLAFNFLIVAGFRAVNRCIIAKKQGEMYQKGPFQ